METPSEPASNTTNGPASSLITSSVSVPALDPMPRRTATTSTTSWDATGSVAPLLLFGRSDRPHITEHAR